MKKYVFSLVMLGTFAIQSNAFALESCTASVPAACNVIGTQVFSSSSNTAFALSVDCKFADGKVTKLTQHTSLQGVLSSLAGAGVENLPRRIDIQKREDNRAALEISCK